MSEVNNRKTILIISQTFVPDPASVGQHMADVAQEMARHGHRVIVFTANRGYENPRLRYPTRQTVNGVDIRRLPFSSFGKRSIFTRALGALSFLVQCALRALLTPDVKGIFFSTSPPLVGAAAVLVALLRRAPTAYWAMDLNPDQLIAMGKLKETDLSAGLLEAVNRFILKRCGLVVALDRCMAERLRVRGVPDSKLVVMPPWPHEEHMETMEPEDSPFRARHGLNGKFVIMYSGNHSPANPLKTLLEAAVRLEKDDSLRFLFVGGGLGKREVESYIGQSGVKNIVSLPYQPLADLGSSLSAADVHVVSLGDEMVGIVHPCKIYGAMTVARPILYFGPHPSHVADLLDEYRFGQRVAHGDVTGAVNSIQTLRGTDRATLSRMGQVGRQVVRQRLSQKALCQQFCNHLERVFGTADG